MVRRKMTSHVKWKVLLSLSMVCATHTHHTCLTLVTANAHTCTHTEKERATKTDMDSLTLVLIQELLRTSKWRIVKRVAAVTVAYQLLHVSLMLGMQGLASVATSRLLT